MYHSIQFVPLDEEVYTPKTSTSVIKNGKNTWDDWHLIPASRPLINPPTVKTNYIEIPGANGILDASDIHAGYPLFNNREGSNEFYVQNGYGDWSQRYSEIMNYLYGRKMRIILEDDPYYYYEGRCSVNQWRSEKDWSKIVLDYNVYPYKKETLNGRDKGYWLWDPFNFETGVLRSWRDKIDNGDYDHMLTYTTIEITALTDYEFNLPIHNEGFTMPSIPIFYVRMENLPGTGSTTFDISLFKKEGSTYTQIGETHTTKFWDTIYHKIKFYDLEIRDGTYEIRFKAGTNIKFQVNMDFRGGML